MRRPLYNQGLDDAECGQDGHKGLWFERFFDQFPDAWDPDPSLPDNPKAAKKIKKDWTRGKSAWISGVAGTCGDTSACEAATQRQRQLCTDQSGKTHIAQVQWHFVTGLGLPHPIENGFLWHPTLGTPYIPGSAVKGLVRAWVESWDDLEPEKRQDRLYQWFGSEHKDPRQRTSNDRQSTIAGDFIFLDALPIKTTTLTADIMTPHMGQWYQSGSQTPGLANTTPADWHDPTPVPFLVANQPIFQFCVLPRNSESATDLPLVMKALEQALEWLGAGGKTAVGYGQMSKLSASSLSAPSETTVWKNCTLTLNKGNMEIRATGPDGERGSVRGDSSKDLIAQWSDTDKKRLGKNRLDANIEVTHTGGKNWTITKIILSR